MAVGGTAPEQSRIFVQVPKDADPGLTKLRVHPDDGNKELIVTVPREAVPEDLLVLTELIQKDGKSWQVSIVPSEAARNLGILESDSSEQRPQEACSSSAQVLSSSPPNQSLHGAGEEISLYQVTVDPESSFNLLVAAARAAGAFINEKMARAAIPPTGMVGIVAQAPIAKGEVIARMPSSLHISAKTLPLNMPELYGRMEQLQGFLPQFEKDIRVAACVTKLLAQAMQRFSSHAAVVPTGDVLTVWALYVDQLLGENFQNHPYWHWVTDGANTVKDMLPSPEGPHAEFMAADILRSFRIIKEAISDDILGPGVDSGLFLHARLSMLSRVFHTHPEYSSLVPVVDLFNHSSEPSCDWAFDKNADCMLLTASRAHAVGEQLWISYGMRSNPILFRTYGFTLPPHMEPAWCYILQLHKPRDIYVKYLTPAHFELSLHLETRLLQETFVESLHACTQGGHDASDFVLDLCSQLRQDYECDTMIQPELSALRRVRSKSPSSAAWWEELESRNNGHREHSPWREACVSSKMSEYLCLTAHIETCEWAAGRLKEEHCLKEAATFRRVLAEAFAQLRQHGRFKLVTSPVLS